MYSRGFFNGLFNIRHSQNHVSGSLEQPFYKRSILRVWESICTPLGLNGSITNNRALLRENILDQLTCNVKRLGSSCNTLGTNLIDSRLIFGSQLCGIARVEGSGSPLLSGETIVLLSQSNLSQAKKSKNFGNLDAKWKCMYYLYPLSCTNLPFWIAVDLATLFKELMKKQKVEGVFIRKHFIVQMLCKYVLIHIRTPRLRVSRKVHQKRTWCTNIAKRHNSFHWIFKMSMVNDHRLLYSLFSKWRIPKYNLYFNFFMR